MGQNIEKNSYQILNYETLPESAEKIKQELKKHIIAQDRAIEMVVKKYITSIFANPNRPKGIFFLAGPTGVGKTELVKVFAEYLFDDREALTIIDCNTLKNENDIWRLIGSPAGYVGFREKNRLIDQRQIDMHGFIKSIQDKLLQNTNQSLSKEIEELEKQKHNINLQIEYLVKTIKSETNPILKQKQINNLTQYKKNLSNIKKQIKELQEYELINQNPQNIIKKAKKYYKNLLSKINLLNTVTNNQTQNSELIQAQETLINFEEKYEYQPGEYESIILFDEFEKMHPNLYDLILSILDEARLSLNDNTTVKFHNAFIFFTSNIGSAEIKKIITSSCLGFSAEKKSQDLDKEIYESTLAAIDKFFEARPEILGRIGKENIIIFRPFQKEHIKQILENCIIPEIKKLISKNIQINIEVDESFKNAIVEEAFDNFNRPRGARPLLRIVKNKLEEPLGILLIKKELQNGDKIIISWNKKPIFKKII